MKMKKIFISICIAFIFSQDREGPSFTVITNDNPYPGKLFVHSMSQYMAILDTNFENYWIINNLNKGMDFKKNNTKLSFYHKPNTSLNEALWIIADGTMTEVDTVQCTSGMTDYHDMIITDNNTYILQSYDSEVMDLSSVGGNEFEVINSILRIQEFSQNHNLIFDWYAADHLNIFDYVNTLLIEQSIGGQTSWMHGNSIDVDYDNNLILSNRTSSEIIKIDRITGEIIWIIGGPLNEFQIINDPLNGVKMQHDVSRLENGNILVFDNGDLQTYPESRVVEYEIDEINKTATLVWEFQNPDGYLSRAMGSAQRLPNGNTLINWGTLFVSNQSIGANIMEVDYQKNIVLEIQYDDYQTYKATKSDFEFNIPMQIGDINLDETLNVNDIIIAVNYLLNNDGNHSIFNLYKIDSNLDHTINILDIISIVNKVLSN